MRKILRLDMAPVVRLFAFLYAAIGLYVSSKAAILGYDSVTCPFGFEYPMAHWTVNLPLQLPHPASLLTWVFVLISAASYGLTGVISGAVAVYAYNHSTQFWPGFSGELAGEEQAAAQPETGYRADLKTASTPPEDNLNRGYVDSGLTDSKKA